VSWDLTTAKRTLGINLVDVSSDLAITKLMDTVIATVENLLGRGLLRRREVIEFYDVVTDKLRLPRYPIITVFSINNAPIFDQSAVHNRGGWVKVNRGGYVLIDY
jgi:hypothetical protein